MTRPVALRRGAGGEAVRDLQRRLAALGHAVVGDDPGAFGPATESSVRAFQARRGLPVDGVCGRHTWAALVESGFALGDRMLYFRQPMLRGDDVAELQRRLNRLGFDAGREDGILGAQTAAALGEFQRNAGLAADGICGAATIRTLDRLGSLAAGSVAAVREREVLRQGPHGLDDRRVYVFAAAGFATLGDAVTRGLLEAGAHAMLDASGSEDSAVAAAANRFEADLFVGVQAGTAAAWRCSYFESGTFRSEAGYRVARAVCSELAALLAGAPELCGRAYGLVRETRMAATVCEPVARGDVAAMGDLVARAGDVGRALVRGIDRGVDPPPCDPA